MPKDGLTSQQLIRLRFKEQGSPHPVVASTYQRGNAHKEQKDEGQEGKEGGHGISAALMRLAIHSTTGTQTAFPSIL